MIAMTASAAPLVEPENLTPAEVEALCKQLEVSNGPLFDDALECLLADPGGDWAKAFDCPGRVADTVWQYLAGWATPTQLRFGRSARWPTGWGEYGETLGANVEYARWITEMGGLGGKGPLTTLMPPPEVSSRASSLLAPQGRFTYGADQAIDRDTSTAWCEGAEGSGVGEWIEVSADPVAGRPFVSLWVVTGHTASKDAWRRNGRPTRVRIASCSHPDRAFEAPVVWPGVVLDSAYFRAGREVPIPEGALQGEGACVRITLTSVAEGSEPDACLAEVVPLRRHEAARGGGESGATSLPPLECRDSLRKVLGSSQASRARANRIARINRLAWDAVRGTPNAWADLLSTCAKPGNEHFSGSPQALAWRRCEIARKVAKSKAVSACSQESGADPASGNLTRDVCMGRVLADALGTAAHAERLPLDQLGMDGVP